VPVSLRYVTRETATNLWRNRLMAIAAVLTVGVSLSLVGSALLLRQAVNNQLTVLNANVDLQVFMKAGASAPETGAIRTLIAGTHEIKSYKYLDHQQSYEQAVRLFSAAGETAAISALTPATTPPVFQCTLAHPGEASTVAQIFDGQAGVYHVAYPAKSIHDLESLSNILQIVLLGLAIVLLVSAVVLILNAIRMAIFARRREVGVMRLVGATSWFIRLPFMVEGLLQGLVGAALAVGIVLLGDLGIKALLHRFPEFATAIVPTHDVLVTEILVVATGIIVGVGGSAMAVRRFLDV
jgi:cell division transport system permease protein